MTKRDELLDAAGQTDNPIVGLLATVVIVLTDIRTELQAIRSILEDK